MVSYLLTVVVITQGRLLRSNEHEVVRKPLYPVFDFVEYVYDRLRRLFTDRKATRPRRVQHLLGFRGHRANVLAVEAGSHRCHSTVRGTGLHWLFVSWHASPPRRAYGLRSLPVTPRPQGRFTKTSTSTRP